VVPTTATEKVGIGTKIVIFISLHSSQKQTDVLNSTYENEV